MSVSEISSEELWKDFDASEPSVPRPEDVLWTHQLEVAEKNAKTAEIAYRFAVIEGAPLLVIRRLATEMTYAKEDIDNLHDLRRKGK